MRETVLAVVLAKVVFVASGVTVVGEVASGRGCVLLDLHELKWIVRTLRSAYKHSGYVPW